jgi:hypothetical protein
LLLSGESFAPSNQLAGNSARQSVRYFPAENPQPEHFGGRQLRSEVGIKVTPLRLNERIHLTLLHPVVHDDSAQGHGQGLSGRLDQRVLI